ncbi:unnamed protein product [Meganyctiphanes norvegica]|uniref:N-acetyltransferase domain-containing protein n=1 Tax=Meganyctiphanes norvegica TaxID=48144 RepID=A0AAV2RGJ7_MEGNR
MSDIEYPLLTESDLPELRTLIKEAFAPREPTTLCLHATPDEVMTYFMDITEECIKNNGQIHVGARDPNSGKLVGCCVNNILTKERMHSPWTYAKVTNDKERTFREIFIEVESHDDVMTRDNVDRLFEYALLTVDPNFGGKGIAKKLVKMSEEVAIKEGVKVGLTVTTNIISQNIFTKLGYKVYHTMDYATLEIGGKRVLDPVPAGETKGLILQSKFLF